MPRTLCDLGGAALRHLLREFVEHYHAERYHQALDGKLIRPTPVPANDNHSLNFYFLDAA